jgi:alpha-tubulin suppressor-like RCC1 family protein
VHAEYASTFSEPIRVAVDPLPLGVTAEVATVDPAGLLPGSSYALITLRIRGAAAAGPVQVTARAATDSHGAASLSVPFTIDSRPGFKLASVSAGDDVACGLDASGKAYCWGDNNYGQLGIGNFGNAGGDAEKTRPTPVTGGLSFAKIYAATASAACGLTSAGKAYCWGEGSALGDGTSTKSAAPVAVAFNEPFTELSVGSALCGLTSAGVAYCWDGANGFLGNGTYDTGTVPTLVSGGHTFRSLSSWQYTTCGVTPDGEIYCWGANDHGMLGDGTSEFRREPVKVVSKLTFDSVAVGAGFTCGLVADGTAYCWGTNLVGKLGLGTSDFDDHFSPTAVSGSVKFVSLRTGAGACGIDANGAAHCWSYAGTEPGMSDIVDAPTPLLGGLAFTDVSVGSSFACGIASNGLAATYCWSHSSNNQGHLGTGDDEDYAGPVPIASP